MMFGGLFLLALFVGLVVWLAGSGRRYPAGPTTVTGHSTALDIVRERYARGEIDRDEFQRLLNDLKT